MAKFSVSKSGPMCLWYNDLACNALNVQQYGTAFALRFLGFTADKSPFVSLVRIRGKLT